MNTCIQCEQLEAENQRLRAELEHVPKQTAEMRDALKKHHDHASENCNVFFEQDGKPIDLCTDLGEAYQDSSLCEQTCAALRPEAGQGYLSPAEVREAVKPLVDALKRFAACNPTGLVSIPRNKIFLWKPSQTSRDLPGISLADIDYANVALEHAKAKGLI